MNIAHKLQKLMRTDQLIFKLKEQNRELKSNYDILLKERGELIDYLKSLDYPPAQQVLVGPIELVKHIVNHLIRSRDLAVEDMKGAMERSESKSRKIEELNNIIKDLVEFDKILK